MSVIIGALLGQVFANQILIFDAMAPKPREVLRYETRTGSEMRDTGFRLTNDNLSEWADVFAEVDQLVEWFEIKPFPIRRYKGRTVKTCYNVELHYTPRGDRSAWTIVEIDSYGRPGICKGYEQSRVAASVMMATARMAKRANG